MRNKFNVSMLPTMPFAIAVVCGVVCALFVPLAEAALDVVLIAVFSLSFILAAFRQTRRALFFASLFCLFILAFARAEHHIGRDPRWSLVNLARQDTACVLTGRVCFPASESWNQGHVLISDCRLRQGDVEKSLGDLRVRLYSDSCALSHLRSGDLVAARGRLQAASQRAAQFSGALTSILSRREAGSLFADSSEVFVQNTGGHYFRRSVDRSREFIKRSFEEELDPDAAALCKALILGDRQDFGYRFNEQLRLTGLSHIFALSGLNTGLIISLLWITLGIFWIPRTPRLWLLLFAALWYMELGREVPSLTRATLMCSVFLVGMLLQRRTHVLSYVAAALMIELLWHPLDLVDPGFALSYLSVFGMIAVFQVLRQRISNLLGSQVRGFKSSLAEIIVGTGAAQLGTIPLVALLFHRIPLIGALGNLIVVPGFAFMLVAALLLLLLKLCFPFLAYILAPAVSLTAAFLARAVDLFGSLPLSGIAVAPVSGWMVLVVYLGIFGSLMLLLMKRFRGAVAALTAIGLLLVLFAGDATRQNTRLTFIDVGNGDATLIESHGRRLLVDAGPRYLDWSAASIIIPYLQDYGIAGLDGLILTHPDNDHIGGSSALLNRLRVENLFTNGDSSNSRSFIELALAAEDAGLSMQQLTAAGQLRLSATCNLTVLSPDLFTLNSCRKTNQKSLVLRVDAEDCSALLTADVDSTIELRLLPWGSLLDTDLLRIAHHGSKSSSCRRFLQACSPDISVITCGRRNVYGHPAPEVLARLDSLNYPYLTTAESATLCFEATRTGWKQTHTRSESLCRLWHLPYG